MESHGEHENSTQIAPKIRNESGCLVLRGRGFTSYIAVLSLMILDTVGLLNTVSSALFDVDVSNVNQKSAGWFCSEAVTCYTMHNYHVLGKLCWLIF